MSRVSGFPGEGKQLKLDHPNEGSRLAVPARVTHAARRRRHDESGQAMVEFALILFPLLILVVGIIQFGIGLNYWLDMNRLSNQGAAGRPSTSTRGAHATARTTPRSRAARATSLQQYIACQRLPGALKPTVNVTFPSAASGYTGKNIGDPVKVEVSSPFTFRAIMALGTIQLKGADDDADGAGRDALHVRELHSLGCP